MFDVIVVGGGPAGLSAGLMLGRCRRRVLVCDFGQPRNRRSRALHGYLTRDGIEPLARNGIDIRGERIAALDHRDGELARVVFEGGGAIDREALFFTTAQHPQSSLAAALGCKLTRRGVVKTGSLCDTNVDRVF